MIMTVRVCMCVCVCVCVCVVVVVVVVVEYIHMEYVIGYVHICLIMICT